ncbi:hypothetical protein ACS0TY_020990 [Phlomoides rotata]
MSDYVPEEILIKILIEVPCVQSMAKSHQKPLLHIRSSPMSENQALVRRYDINDRREHYSVVPKTGVFGINPPSRELELPFVCPTGFFRIVGSCDGLVCLADYFVDRLSTVIIWNPAIRNHVVSPQPLVNPNEAHDAVLGFGVVSNVYKVVRIVHCGDDDEFFAPPEAEIFSLGTGRWRKLSGFVMEMKLS